MRRVRSRRVRHNINFMDKPLFVTSNKLAKSQSYSDNSGFSMTVSNTHGLPTMFDKKVMYMILAEVQRLNQSVLKYDSIFELLDNFNIPCSQKNYDRTLESLRKLATVTITYEGETYYERPSDTRMRVQGFTSFHIIDNVKVTKQGIVLDINSVFIRSNEQLFSRSIPIMTLTKFTNAVAMRLFELTSKVINSNSWSISLDKLQLKLGITYNDMRDARRSLDLAVKELQNLPEYKHFHYTIDKNKVVTFMKK